MDYGFLSRRARLSLEGGKQSKSGPPPYSDITHKIVDNQQEYHPRNNPNGHVILSVAENSLNFPLIRPHLNKEVQYDKHDILYPGKWGGTSRLKKALASYFEKFVTVNYPIQPKNFELQCGCGTIVQNISRAICDEGDSIMIAQPYYPGFDEDIATVGVNRISVNMEGGIRELNRIMDKHENVKALLLCNPDNPTGKIWTETELTDLIDWARRRKIHLISDEVYAQSRISLNPTFVSVATAITNRDPSDRLGEYVHIIYGLSKDFSLAGWRVGMLYSENDAIRTFVNSKCYFGAVPSPVLRWMEVWFEDMNTVSSFLASSHQKLRTQYERTARMLKYLGVPFSEPEYGLFIWTDFSQWLDEDSFEAERRFFYKLLEAKVVVTPGEACHGKRPGFFRMCFAYCDGEALDVARDRMAALKRSCGKFRGGKL